MVWGYFSHNYTVLIIAQISPIIHSQPAGFTLYSFLRLRGKKGRPAGGSHSVSRNSTRCKEGNSPARRCLTGLFNGLRCPHRSAPLGRGLPSATAAPAPPRCFCRRQRAALQPFGFPFDKIWRQIAHSTPCVSHTICRQISLEVSAPVGTCPPVQTFLCFFDSLSPAGNPGGVGNRIYTERNPLPTISLLLTMVMKAWGSCRRTKRRRCWAWLRVSTVISTHFSSWV